MSVLHEAQKQPWTYIVIDGADDTATTPTVPSEVDTAASAQRIIIGIDEVVWSGVRTCTGIPEAVCPGRNSGQVGG
jgi:hypothetical protein